MNKPHSIKGLWATMQESTLEPLLKKAKELEKKYEWLQAADCYKKASIILLKDKDFVKAAEFQENLGYCFFRAALQAETKEQFETRMQLASKKYEQTFLIFEKLEGKEAGKNHAKAMVAYTSSWCEHDLSKMEILLDEWWTLENKALSIYEKMQNPLDIGKTCNNILEYSVDRQIWFIWFNTKEYVNRYKKLLDIGEKAIAALRKTNYKYEIARAYCWTGWFYGRGPKGQQTLKDHLKKSQNYSKKALSLAKEIGDGWLIGWSYNAISEEFGLSAKNFTTWLNQGIKVLEQGRIIKDNYMMVTGKWKAGMIIYQAIKFEEDPEKKRQTIRKAIKWTSEAIAQAKLINFPIGILLSQTFHCRNLISLAWLEPNLQEKRKLTLEAVKLGREGVEYSKSFTMAFKNRN
jgi:tetratricopeptide (TPR) repeat protein